MRKISASRSFTKVTSSVLAFSYIFISGFSHIPHVEALEQNRSIGANAAEFPTLQGVNTKDVSIINPGVDITFNTPANNSNQANLQVNLNVTLKNSNNPTLVGKDLKVYFVVSNLAPTFENMSRPDFYGINATGLNDFDFTGNNDTDTITAENVLLPFAGENYLMCWVIWGEISTNPGAEGGYGRCGAVDPLGQPKYIKLNYTGNSSPLYRFWGPSRNGHFYTASTIESVNLQRNNPTWKYETVAYSVIRKDDCAGANTVYRFYSPSDKLDTHFYTIKETEKDNIIATNNYTNGGAWIFEGTAFCAKAAETAGYKPVYRFWGPNYMNHFYTISEAEKNNIIATNNYNNGGNWLFEGVSYYAKEILK